MKAKHREEITQRIERLKKLEAHAHDELNQMGQGQLPATMDQVRRLGQSLRHSEITRRNLELQIEVAQ